MCRGIESYFGWYHACTADKVQKSMQRFCSRDSSAMQAFGFKCDSRPE